MVTFARINRMVALLVCAWVGLCALGCAAGLSLTRPPGPTPPQAVPAQSLSAQTALPQQVPRSQPPPAQPMQPQQAPQADQLQAQPAQPQQPQAQPVQPRQGQAAPMAPQQAPPQVPQLQAPPAQVQPPQAAAINVVGIWESQIMTGYGVMFTQMILQPNGSYSYQVRLGNLMTWEVGLYEVGQGFIHFSVQNYEPKEYMDKQMSRPTSWTVFYTVVDQDTMIWEDRVLDTQWTVYRRR